MSDSNIVLTRLKGFWEFLKLLGATYQKDGCQSTAAALTYQTLFAVVPLLTITYTVLASFEAFSGVGEMLQNFLFDNVVPENVAVVESYLQDFSDQARSLSIPSLVVLAIAAFLMMFTIEKSFNEIWRVREPRHGFQRILMYWAVLTLGPPIVGGGIAMTTYFLSLPLFSDVTNTPGFLHLLPVALNTMVFTLMYLTIPNCVVPLRHGLVGGLTVAILFELVKRLFGTVMSQTDFEVIYGTYAAVPLFLIWIYLSWAIILLGAELAKALGLYHSHRSAKTEAPLVQLLIILREFFRCHRKGEVLTDKILASMRDRVDLQNWNDYKSQLLSLGVIRPVERGGLVLSKDLNEVTLWEIYQATGWTLPEGFRETQSAWEEAAHQSLSSVTESGQKTLDIDLESLFRSDLSNSTKEEV